MDGDVQRFCVIAGVVHLVGNVILATLVVSRVLE